MTKTTTMSRDETAKNILIERLEEDKKFDKVLNSLSIKIWSSKDLNKLQSYIQSLLTSRDNEWRERIIRKAISVFRNEVGIEEFEWDGGESKIEDVVKKCLEQMEDKK